MADTGGGQGQPVAPPESIKGTTYPQNAQICYSSLRRGGDGEGSKGVGGAVICPEGFLYCVKEVMPEVSQEICGKYQGTTDYFGDTFDSGENLCVYRKCAKICEQKQTSFQVGPEEYTRQTYCCTNKPGFRGEPCNAAMGGPNLSFQVVLIISILCLWLMR
mmetsp:Transcript_3582/g.6753  ORF Transcript_3582/g.6753 Transcript_3582/m.6753 type:complete len:161 (-) Transcript_3582:36-518(-)